MNLGKYKKSILITFLVFSSCCVPTDDINVELTTFAKDLVLAFSDCTDEIIQGDTTFSYVLECTDKSVVLFENKTHSNRDFVGKAKVNGKTIKIYGLENPYIYEIKNKTRDDEGNGIDGDYTEDLLFWDLTFAHDTILIYATGYDNNTIKKIGNICMKHFPKKTIMWKRNSFRIDDICL